MGLFIAFVSILVIADFGLIILAKKVFKSEKQIRILFLIYPILTILCHYSSLIYHSFTPDYTPLQFMTNNPNLVLPIYPCNVVMWLLLLLGIFWNKRENRFFRIVIDFCFYFGIIGALIGMFVNVDFIREPTLKNFDITKGIVAHAFMLMNLFALPFFKLVKIDLHSNFAHVVVGVVGLGILGLYNSLLITVFAGENFAQIVNSMFILHSPFEGFDWVTYPVIALIGLPIYFLIFQIMDLIAYKKGNRWIHREKHW